MCADKDDLDVAAPPTKVLKLDPEDVASTSFKIRPLLHPEILSEACSLGDFHVLRLNDKKQIGKFVKLASALPEEFSHLKRVDKSGRIVIQPAKEQISDEILSCLKELDDAAWNLEIVAVPLIKPKTLKQAIWARKYWPTAFHPNKETEDLLNDQYFNEENSSKVFLWSQKALNIGCIVVQKGEYLTEGTSSTRLLGHAVMEMIENLARKERKESEYLATDCDVFLAVEPCAMCAMALVHCRASRVFFCRKSKNGVFSEGSWQFHLTAQFNHHYKVFHVDSGEEEIKICFNSLVVFKE